ncbi:hypothetical protein FUAX_49110 (plasmid) [Fulvitalea axinellae]|uniref:Uncharacterized protein n=2 Tax=Fulvitalea axinellae TaxID=1182444 RepID=A0AAU9CK63_9BACT|nr:hypothetical protein FUAX_49110 [Fulvitalea axinellae]
MGVFDILSKKRRNRGGAGSDGVTMSDGRAEASQQADWQGMMGKGPVQAIFGDKIKRWKASREWKKLNKDIKNGRTPYVPGLDIRAENFSEEPETEEVPQQQVYPGQYNADYYAQGYGYHPPYDYGAYTYPAFYNGYPITEQPGQQVGEYQQHAPEGYQQGYNYGEYIYPPYQQGYPVTEQPTDVPYEQADYHQQNVEYGLPYPERQPFFPPDNPIEYTQPAPVLHQPAVGYMPPEAMMERYQQGSSEQQQVFPMEGYMPPEQESIRTEEPPQESSPTAPEFAPSAPPPATTTGEIPDLATAIALRNSEIEGSVNVYQENEEVQEQLAILEAVASDRGPGVTTSVPPVTSIPANIDRETTEDDDQLRLAESLSRVQLGVDAERQDMALDDDQLRRFIEQTGIDHQASQVAGGGTQVNTSEPVPDQTEIMPSAPSRSEGVLTALESSGPEKEDYRQLLQPFLVPRRKETTEALNEYVLTPKGQEYFKKRDDLVMSFNIPLFGLVEIAEKALEGGNDYTATVTQVMVHCWEAYGDLLDKGYIDEGKGLSLIAHVASYKGLLKQEAKLLEKLKEAPSTPTEAPYLTRVGKSSRDRRSNGHLPNRLVY